MIEVEKFMILKNFLCFNVEKLLFSYVNERFLA